ncbi:MAG: hypothetical protein ACLR0U_29265 [Enterocloster clostridioformis]
MIEIISQDISQTIKLFKQNKEINEICRIIDKSDNIYAYGTGHGQRLMLREFCSAVSECQQEYHPDPVSD